MYHTRLKNLTDCSLHCLQLNLSLDCMRGVNVYSPLHENMHQGETNSPPSTVRK